MTEISHFKESWTSRTEERPDAFAIRGMKGTYRIAGLAVAILAGLVIFSSLYYTFPMIAIWYIGETMLIHPQAATMIITTTFMVSMVPSFIWLTIAEIHGW